MVKIYKRPSILQDGKRVCENKRKDSEKNVWEGLPAVYERDKV
ncbi:hypothetical protein J23TS9_47520 [Paenibacillus sp. J23TS9]|nr:hypothetical protein J23TS9_47520 [Paenibacillus sp. J23TS9]